MCSWQASIQPRSSECHLHTDFILISVERYISPVLSVCKKALYIHNNVIAL